MAYSYGTQGAPAVGGGAPGLPSRWQPAASTYTRIVSGSGVLIPPQGAKFMRVAVIGGGAGGTPGVSGKGGGGGGCAATKIIQASNIAYSIAAAVGASTDGISTTATLPGYLLIGGGGFTNGNPGVGSGGDFNYLGGAGAVGTYGGCGGGGAGPNGAGGSGSPRVAVGFSGSGTNGDYTGLGWGPGGGQGGSAAASNNNVVFAFTGGAGTGRLSGTAYPHSATGYDGASVITTSATDAWGVSSVSVGPTTSGGIKTSIGGEMGGGGVGAYDSFNSVNLSSGGGSGGMVVEWFY